MFDSSTHDDDNDDDESDIHIDVCVLIASFFSLVLVKERNKIYIVLDYGQ